MFSWSSLATFVAATLVAFVVGLSAIGGWAWATFGSRTAAAAYLRGESLLIEPRVFDFGLARDGDRRVVKLGLVNLTGKPVSVFGFTASCQPDGCLASPDKYPLEIPPRGRIQLTVECTFAAGRAGAESRPLRVATDVYTNFGMHEIACRGILDGGAGPSP